MQKKRVPVVETLRCGLALDGLRVRDRAGGNRTLMTSRPGDFKSPASTISPPPLLVWDDIIMSHNIRQISAQDVLSYTPDSKVECIVTNDTRHKEFEI